MTRSDHSDEIKRHEIKWKCPGDRLLILHLMGILLNNPDTRPLVSPKRGAGAGVGVGMSRGRGILG